MPKGEFLIEEVVEIGYGGERMGRKSGAKEYEGGTKSAPLAADISGPVPEYRHCIKKKGIVTLTGTALLPGRSAGGSAGRSAGRCW